MNDKIKLVKNTPKRLSSIYQCYSNPVYFVTFNTMYRINILDNRNVFDLFVEYALTNLESGRAVGKFMIMPDHIHFFVRLDENSKLSIFVSLMKQFISKNLSNDLNSKKIWQPGFFDHLLRNGESYSEKWHYVMMNPVRYGFVDKSEDWSWQGEITRIEF